ncbi:MAG TPA: MlaD family protein [Lentimicrobium sp.]|nr:MlaD family protein [Lentimicrobium sp.]
MKTIALSRELKIGITTVVTIIAFIWGFNYLKGKNVFNRQRTYFVAYDNVAGLMKANTVSVSGLSIGQVDDIFFDEKRPSQVIVELTVSNKINIPKNSVARLYSSDLLGTKGIEIVLGNSSEFANSGDTLKADIASSLQEEVNQMVQPILKKAGNMISSIDTVLTAVGKVFNFRTRNNLVESVESLRHTMQNIQSTTQSIDTLMGAERERLGAIFRNVESITSNLERNNENLNRIISNATLISDTIAKFNLASTLSNLERSITNLTSATDKINKGEGTIGQLLNDQTLYDDLQSSSKQLDLLLEDIRLNPRRYVHFSVFGKSGKMKSATLTDSVK